MATLRQKLAAERKVRQILDENHVQAPDEIEYGYTCIRLFWLEPKVGLVIDIDEPPPELDTPELDTPELDTPELDTPPPELDARVHGADAA